MQVLIGDGCGNRFALVEAAAITAAETSPGLILHQCRDLDIDGLLVLDGFKLAIYNADGSDGGACYNGLRMAAVASGLDSGSFEMAGLHIKWHKVDDDIELNLPLSVSEIECASLLIEGVQITTVALSNPHAIVKNYAGYEQEFAEKLQADTEHFPESVNVECVKHPYPNGQIEARIFERGVGETLACGTGAVALAVDAYNDGFDGEITVKTWGGSLFLNKTSDGKISLRGAARLTGNIDLDLA
ncbi:MAG: diaminopimelate epimerase [Myxococcota bacterium]|jgi:diaminopimelate epimerase